VLGLLIVSKQVFEINFTFLCLLRLSCTYVGVYVIRVVNCGSEWRKVGDIVYSLAFNLIYTRIIKCS
jgi:hypothetical protein